MRFEPVDGPGEVGPAPAETAGCTGPLGTAIRFGPALCGTGGCRVSPLAPPKLDATWPVPEMAFATAGPVAEIVVLAVLVVSGPTDTAARTALPPPAATGLSDAAVSDRAEPLWLL